ncbi:REP-associated tyrosine transposase [Desulfobulbus alkaliphilus]|uniref:REP-associated tyrosine transposase n=1 Tax=Desulfobulbus alkaliphilus TaxID=869814 RepID=UPI0019630599|nr:transposase [Desulfobulbus alkaliphilus]MBM9537078.1 transposase [Desulfobulbus alkaliphilus]
MPRIARIIAPGYPHHITQRGNNRAVVFYDDEDRQTYLELLATYAKKYGLQIWAWCLMDNHVHLLVVPATESGLARGIGLTNMVYTQYFNRKQGQSGRIWQNRFFSCVIEHQAYLWAVARYIERNPLKAGLVKRVEDYRWSSGSCHVAGVENALLHQPDWLDPTEQRAYAEFCRGEDDGQDNAIRKATQSGRPLGGEGFVGVIEKELNRSIRTKRAGRPRR